MGHDDGANERAAGGAGAFGAVRRAL